MNYIYTVTIAVPVTHVERMRTFYFSSEDEQNALVAAAPQNGFAVTYEGRVRLSTTDEALMAVIAERGANPS